MIIGSKTPIVPPLQDPESGFHKKKDKKVNESTSSFQSDKGFESFDRTPDKKGIGYEVGNNIDTDDDIKIEVEEMANITRMIIGDYKERICKVNGLGLVPL